MKLILRHQPVAEEVVTKLRNHMEVEVLLLEVTYLLQFLVYLC